MRIFGFFHEKRKYFRHEVFVLRASKRDADVGALFAGRVIDKGVKDASNMGAAMAPLIGIIVP